MVTRHRGDNDDNDNDDDEILVMALLALIRCASKCVPVLPAWSHMFLTGFSFCLKSKAEAIGCRQHAT